MVNFANSAMCKKTRDELKMIFSIIFAIQIEW